MKKAVETDLQVVKKVLKEFKKYSENKASYLPLSRIYGGLCSFSQTLFDCNIININEFRKFISIIYKYRKKYVSEDRQSSMFFFDWGVVAPRIEFLEKIVDDLNKKEKKK